MMRTWLLAIIAIVGFTSAAQAAWVVKTTNLACTQDYNEWGYGSFCPCPESSVYNAKIGQCLTGERYPILIQGALRSRHALTRGVFLDTEQGRFHLVVKRDELKKLQKADGLYFEVEGEFLLWGRPTILVDRLSWLE